MHELKGDVFLDGKPMDNSDDDGRCAAIDEKLADHYKTIERLGSDWPSVSNAFRSINNWCISNNYSQIEIEQSKQRLRQIA